jgi:hypothetical protein
MNLVRRRRRLAAILTLANGKWAGKIIAFRWEHITHTYPQNPPPNKGCEGSRSCKLLKGLAPQVGLEPTTLRLTAECSAIELLRSEGGQSDGQCPAPMVPQR